MILIFGGTTEGRLAAQVCDGASKTFYYSTKSDGQRIDAVNAIIVSGAMTKEDIIEFCRDREIKLIIDAAHPFAAALHNTVVAASKELNIPIVRYERRDTERVVEDRVRYFESIEGAVEYISKSNYRRILALTGVKSSRLLYPLTLDREVRLRIMDRKESWQIVSASNFPRESVVIYGSESDESLLESFSADVVLIKESGESGGVPSKIELTERLGVDLLIVERPKIEGFDRVVYGRDGLRLAIDRALPCFFELSTGLTTGSCATAATVAALHNILSGEVCDSVEFALPSGEMILVDVASQESGDCWAEAALIKDGGDDPDVTHGAEIRSRVTINRDTNGIVIRGGEGVGVVTLEGLDLRVGDSAINTTPRRMICDNVTRLLKEYSINCGVDVEISVPKGRELAKRTFNGRLGIVDGISILGTSGIVHPFSREAFLESIERHIKVVRALGSDTVVINSGGKSERFLKSHFSDIPPQMFVQYGNMIGDTLSLSREASLKRVILGVMIGKAVKLAAGNLDTHSQRAVMDREFIAKVARHGGYSSDICDKILAMETARQLWEIIPSGDRRLFDRLKELCYRQCSHVIGDTELEIVLVRDNGEIF